MPHHTPLIGTLVIAIVLAFLLGAVANRLRISPLVGYLLAGVLVGPFTPGYVADQALASDLAEIGVILLMFGVGLHFSLKDLLSVKAIAIPGALAQMLVATLLGMGVARLSGWPTGAGFVFGLALSVASTVVLTRALQERHLMQTERGRIAVGWLVVQDLAMVLVLVLIPALAGILNTGGTAAAFDDILRAGGITLAKVLAFVALMLIVGQRVIPEILHYVAHTGSRELFRLAVLAIALGVAYGAAQLFGVSFALGAFFAGMILSESTLSQRAAEESLPLRDAFAVLFFVSVGMLFNPAILLRNPFSLAATLVVILICNPVAAYLIVRLSRHPVATALTIGASLAQIGEFSFILAGLGVNLKILPPEGQDLILAGAILSILVNPFYFTAITRLKAKFRLLEPNGNLAAAKEKEEEEIPPTALREHAVIVGFGRVGTIVGERLRREEKPFLVIEERQKTADAARRETLEVIVGNAADPRVLAAANLAAARWLFIAIPDGFEAGQVSEQARRANAKLEIVARAHSDAEVEHLQKHGANFVIMGEREIALGMLDHTFGPPAGAAAPKSLT